MLAKNILFWLYKYKYRLVRAYLLESILFSLKKWKSVHMGLHTVQPRSQGLYPGLEKALGTKLHKAPSGDWCPITPWDIAMGTF